MQAQAPVRPSGFFSNLAPSSYVSVFISALLFPSSSVPETLVHEFHIFYSACGSDVCLFECYNLFEYVALHGCERLTELCATSACEHLLYITKTIFTEFYLSAVLRKIQFTFSNVFLIRTISRIIVQYEFEIMFFGFPALKAPVAMATVHPHGAAPRISQERITRNCHLVNIFIKYS